MCAFRIEFWPTESRVINQTFGVNGDYYGRFGLPGHEGVDIAARLGSRVFAVARGRVRVIHGDPATHNYGIHVRLQHDDGFETVYAHLSQVEVGPNQDLAGGDLIGLAGSTGNSTGPHLHLTLKQAGASFHGFPGGIIDPTPFMLPLLGWQEPAGPYVDGWAFSNAIVAFGGLAQANAGGVSLRAAPARNANRLAIVPEGTIMIVTGGRSGEYTPVRVARAAIGLAVPLPPPADPPAATAATVEGWGFATNLFVSGSQALVGDFGINLRATPQRDGANIGLVAAGSTVSVTGPVRGEYLPIIVKRSDFLGPVHLPVEPPPVPADPAGPPAPNTLLGWGSTSFLALSGTQATVNTEFGLNLRAAPQANAAVLGVAKGFATLTLAGIPEGDFTPVVAREADMFSLVRPRPAVRPPQPLPAGSALPPPPPPIHDTTPGWAFTSQITISGTEAIAGPYGINLRAEPRRDATNKGLVPAGTAMIVTGAPQGEYTPVRVDDAIFRPADPGDVPPPIDPPAIGQARFGLHAGADPGDLHESEFAEFAQARPGVIKVLSAHSGPSIARLAAQHPQAAWVIRAFLSFRGGRVISPAQFLNDTISDVERALAQLNGRELVIELHNEPNLSDEGLGSSWADGAQFAAWWSEVLHLYRQRLPGHDFIYPGLSPGPGFDEGGRVRHDHVQFLEAGRAGVEAADGLGVHLYWARDFAMERALAMLDDTIDRFRNKPIWVTEASNNKGGVSPEAKGRQYLSFWAELKKRPAVRGVTYYVASASDPAFGEEIWVGRGIGAVVGQR